MPYPETPAWQIAAVIVMIAVPSTGVILSLRVLSQTSLPAAGTPGSGIAGSCPLVRGNVTYVAEEVGIPAGGPDWGPLTNLTFQGVQFRFWPEFWSSGNVAYLQGTGTEPNGVDLAFVVFPNNSSFGNPSLPNASVRTWLSPDGVFGVTWLSIHAQVLNVRLAVSQPLLTYASENVTLPPSSSMGNLAVTIDFRCVSFTLQLGEVTTAGTWIIASALEPDGTIVQLGIWAGPLVACGLMGPTPWGTLGNASCLESGAPDHSVALLWEGDTNVTLMIRLM
jgi:hypothetical protein